MLNKAIQYITLIFLMICVSACGSFRLPETALPQISTVDEPEIIFDPVSGEYSTEIDVLTYNVAALPWPIRKNRTTALALIGESLKEVRANGVAPDIILLQEGFRRGTKKIIQNAGYPNWVRGPNSKDRVRRDGKVLKYSERAPEKFKKGRKLFKGETTGKVLGSGLYVLSNWPIIKKSTQPFYSRECAGFDCSANKGVLWAEIKVPGMPGHLQLFNTHLNSNGSTTGVDAERTFTAYKLQFDHLDEFLQSVWTEEHPMIFGGDFNAKGSQERLDYISSLSERVSSRRPEIVRLTHEYCKSEPITCKTFLNSKGETPWLDTQDWQGFSSGHKVTVTPIQIIDVDNDIVEEAPEIRGEKTLSDHGAVWVRYRLSWR